MLNNVRNLLEGEARVAVHEDGHIDAVAPDVDFFRLPRIGAPVGAGSAGLPAGIDGSVPRILFPEQLPAHGAGHRAVLVADEAAHLPQRLHLHADVRVFIAVRQHAGAEAGLNVLRFLGGLLLGRNLPVDVIQRKHPLLPVLNEAHVRGYAVHEAVLYILGALIALVGDDVHRFQSVQIFLHSIVF